MRVLRRNFERAQSGSANVTLCVAFVSNRFCVVCSDRRTSGAKINDEYDKMLVINTPHECAVLTFSGLAQANGFDLKKWLVKTVQELGPPTHNLAGIINGLVPRLTELFKTNLALRRGVTDEQRRTSVLIAGMCYFKAKSAVPLYAIISNWENPAASTPPLTAAATEFSLSHGTIEEDGTRCILFIGNLAAITKEPFDVVAEAALTDGPGAIALKLVEVMRKIGGDPRSAHLIGKQISTVIIPNDGNGTIGHYNSAEVRNVVYMPDMVWVGPEGPSAVTNIRVEPTDPASTPVMVVPKVGGKKKCPCGSGRQYKYCHGARDRLAMRMPPSATS